MAAAWTPKPSPTPDPALALRDNLILKGSQVLKLKQFDESAAPSYETENRSLLLVAQTLEELQSLVAERMGYHKVERRHSTIGY